jgi:hypothetical protein
LWIAFHLSDLAAKAKHHMLEIRNGSRKAIYRAAVHERKPPFARGSTKDGGNSRIPRDVSLTSHASCIAATISMVDMLASQRKDVQEQVQDLAMGQEYSYCVDGKESTTTQASWKGYSILLER